MRVEDSFFSVAMTTPFLALIPNEVYPLETAANAFSIWGNLPLEAKVVNEKSLIDRMLFKNYLNYQNLSYLFN